MSDKIVQAYIPANEVFKSEDNSFLSFIDLLAQLSLSDTVLWTIRINQVLCCPQIEKWKQKQEYFIHMFFEQHHIELINQFAIDRGGADSIKVFFRGQLMELMRWALLICKNHESDGRTFTSKQTRVKFAHAALISSDLWWQSFNEKSSEDKAKIFSLNNIRRIVDSNLFPISQEKAFSRAKSLVMNHLKCSYPNLEQEFFDHSGLSLEDYYSCASVLSTNYLPSNVPNLGEDAPIVIFNNQSFDSLSSEKVELLRKFLELETSSIDQLKDELWGSRTSATPGTSNKLKNRVLRNKPVLRLQDGRHIILDSVFFMDKFPLGPLFHLSSRKRGKKGTSKRALFPDFGKAFENYCGEILASMFGNSSILAKRLSFPFMRRPLGKETQNTEIIDACLNDVFDLILFEMKAKFIPEDSLEEESEYLNSLEGKVFEGLDQLANAIKNLESKTWMPLDQDLTKVKRVFPILLVYDRLLDSAKHREHFSSVLKSYLSGYKETDTNWLKLGNWNVAPLTVLTIDMLENLESSVQRFSFTDLLKDYANTPPNLRYSLAEYIANSKYKNLIIHSRLLASHGIELLENTSLTFFDKS